MARYLLGSRDIAKTFHHFLSVTSFHFSIIAANIYQLLRHRSLRRWVFSRFLARLFTLLLFPPSFSVIMFTINKKIKNVKRDPPPLDFNSFPRNSKFSFCSPNWLCVCSGYLLVLNLIFGLLFSFICLISLQRLRRSESRWYPASSARYERLPTRSWRITTAWKRSPSCKFIFSSFFLCLFVRVFFLLPCCCVSFLWNVWATFSSFLLLVLSSRPISREGIHHRTRTNDKNGRSLELEL